MFKAVIIRKDEAGYRTGFEDIDPTELPEADTLVRIDYSTINFKDGLAMTGKAPVVRQFPMVPGIDFAGTVVECSSGDFKPGDKVVLNGWGVGENHWGGLAQMARINSNWLIALPEAFTTRQAMAIGTAGYTAMLCLMAIEAQGIRPENGEVLVTGASGGVGSIAISLLAGRGYNVVASTGKPDQAFLRELGAKEIISRTLLSEPGRPLAKERWAAAIDTVGGHTLANVCASTRYGGVIAACGMAQSLEFPASVAPFILRGVMLAGVDSVLCPKPKRIEAWHRLSTELDTAALDTIAREVTLGEAIDTAHALVRGDLTGRIVVDVNR